MHSSDGHWTRRRFLTDIAFVAGALIAASRLGSKGCSRPAASPSPTETPASVAKPTFQNQAPPNSIRAKGDYVGGSSVRAPGSPPDPGQTSLPRGSKAVRPKHNQRLGGETAP